MANTSPESREADLQQKVADYIAKEGGEIAHDMAHHVGDQIFDVMKRNSLAQRSEAGATCMLTIAASMLLEQAVDQCSRAAEEDCREAVVRLFLDQATEETRQAIAKVIAEPQTPALNSQEHAPDVVWPAMRAMEEWAEYEHKDDMVLLLVEFEENPTEDEGVALTIGSNTDHNHSDEPEGWKMAGWSWCHDCFTSGHGKPLGWMPLPHHLALEQSSQQPPASEVHWTKIRDEWFVEDQGKLRLSTKIEYAHFNAGWEDGHRTHPDTTLRAENEALVNYLERLLPVGSESASDDKVQAFYIRTGELRELRRMIAAHRERQ